MILVKSKAMDEVLGKIRFILINDTADLHTHAGSFSGPLIDAAAREVYVNLREYMASIAQALKGNLDEDTHAIRL